MKTKEDCLTALDALESQIMILIGTLSGDPSSLGHDREIGFAIQRMEESVMWMRRAMERRFA